MLYIFEQSTLQNKVQCVIISKDSDPGQLFINYKRLSRAKQAVLVLYYVKKVPRRKGGIINMNSQLKRGTLELCVLAIVSRKDCYGYELVNQISESMQITEGTIYPLLKRIKDVGYVTTYLKESSEGPPRKYYAVTENGRHEKNRLFAEWTNFVYGMEKIIGREQNG